MNLENDIKKLEKKIAKNSDKITDNAERIKQNSLTIEILRDYKNDKSILVKIVLFLLFMWVITFGYLIYTLNDIGVVEENNTQQITDVDTIEGNIVNKGDANGEGKTS